MKNARMDTCTGLAATITRRCADGSCCRFLQGRRRRRGMIPRETGARNYHQKKGPVARAFLDSPFILFTRRHCPPASVLDAD